MSVKSTTSAKKIAQSPLSEQIYQNLKWSLIIGEHLPGDELSIRTLAAKLGISAMPVREALKRLASERLLESSANRSYRVPGLDPKRVSDQFFLRSRLEGVATSIATTNLTSSEIDQLDELVTLMEQDIKNGDSTNYVLRNYSFHFSIYGAAGNDELVWMIERLWAQTGPFLADIVRKVEMPLDWMVMHSEIAKAIRARNAEFASKLIEQDISWGTNAYLAMLEA